MREEKARVEADVMLHANAISQLNNITPTFGIKCRRYSTHMFKCDMICVREKNSYRGILIAIFY